jgi:YVTN family beta-propeller protein
MPFHHRFTLLGIALPFAAALFAADTPSPALLVLNKTEGSLSIIDPASRKTIATIPTGQSPHELAVSGDGKLAFAANYGAQTPGSTISVIDLVGQRELRRVDLGTLRKPHGLAFAGGKLYFTAELNKLIGRYDPALNQIDWLLGTGQNTTHMVLVSKDGNTIFTANIGSNTISVIEKAPGAGGWNQTVIPVGKGPEALDLSPDGKELWTAHSGDGGVSILDIAAKKVTGTFSVGTARSNRLKFRPDGKRVLISDLAGGELVVLDAASHQPVKRLRLGQGPEGILIVPDGSIAYVAMSGENRLDMVDLKTLTVTGAVPTGPGPDGMAWAVR